MYYGKEAYKKDVPHIEKVKKNKDALSFTYLFDKYYNIVLNHLQNHFRSVRNPVLEDVAIEVIEDWFLNIDSREYEVNKIGFILCLQAKNKVFKILRPKFQIIPSSELKDEKYDKDNFIDLLTYTTFGGVKGVDAAKISFMYKKKADEFIGELNDRDYNLITGFLDGLKAKDICKKTGTVPTAIYRDTQQAFKNLKKLIFDKRNVIFDKQKAQYLNSKVKFKHPEIMKMYYVDKLSISSIADVLKIEYNAVKGRLKRDRDLMRFDGLSWDQIKNNRKVQCQK